MVNDVLTMMSVVSILSGLFQLWFGCSVLLGRWIGL